MRSAQFDDFVRFLHQFPDYTLSEKGGMRTEFRFHLPGDNRRYSLRLHERSAELVRAMPTTVNPILVNEYSRQTLIVNAIPLTAQNFGFRLVETSEGYQHMETFRVPGYNQEADGHESITALSFISAMQEAHDILLGKDNITRPTLNPLEQRLEEPLPERMPQFSPYALRQV